jgi:hypothetical protein
MNCRHVTQLLADGQPLDAQATAHLATCEECRALLAALAEHLDSPSAERLATIGNQLRAALQPVRPLPSNALLIGIGLSVFLLLSVIVASATGLKAIHVLTGGQMALYYGTVCLFAALFARATVERMIPGAKRFAPSSLLAALALTGLGLLVFSMFEERGTDNFVARGIPCLRLGAISALLSGLLGWRLLRKGYLVSPRETITLYGFFAGLVGIAVLALHCPIQNSLHIVVWHIGAMLLAGCAGFLLGSFFENSSHAD